MSRKDLIWYACIGIAGAALCLIVGLKPDRVAQEVLLGVACTAICLGGWLTNRWPLIARRVITVLAAAYWLLIAVSVLVG